MKIVHFITSLKIGGAETALVNFLRHSSLFFPEIKHEVYYIYDGPNVENIQKLGVSVIRISGIFNNYDPIAFIKLFLLIKKSRPDIIHSALWSANFFSRLVGKMLSIPVVCDLHGNADDEGRFRNILDALTAKYSNKIIAVSSSVKDSYEAAVISKISSLQKKSEIKKNLCVINNGIDVQSVLSNANKNKLYRSEFNLNSSHFIIGAVGRLETIKSYDILIKSFAHLISKYSLTRQPKLFIVGDGSQRQKLEELTVNLDLNEHVIFVGFSDSIKFYSMFDCFALSSQSEGLSIALLEALCFGLPIVTTNKGKKHDVLIDQKNGFLVPVNNISEFALAIKKLVCDENLRNSMIMANKELIKSYSLAATVQEYVNIYNNILN